VFKIITKKQLRIGWLGSIGLSIIPVLFSPTWGAAVRIALPKALAAPLELSSPQKKQIYLSLGAFEASVPIEALEIYAEEGQITRDLASYARYLSSQQLARLRTGLRTRINLDPVTISQFLYTPIGEQLLQRLGQVVQTPSRQSGFYAIRAALILAAAEPEGLTALNVLRKFPTQGIRVDVDQALEILDKVKQLVSQTKTVVSAISSQSQAQGNAGSKINSSQLPALQFQGPFTWRKETLRFEDPRRAGLRFNSSTGRTFLVDLYLPKVIEFCSLPVIVFSHGLGSDRLTYEYLAKHLASYGFVVAVPEHLGSSTQQLTALLNGQANRIAQPTEFVDRSLDIKFLLDELERRSTSETPHHPQFQRINYRHLDLQQVGIIGHSFGGYTALALAGAEPNFNQLRKDCGENLRYSLNVSLLLQCQALTLPKRKYDLSEPRVKAVIAINPIGSSLFGQSGLSSIKIPTLIVAGSADIVAPALFEQIQPFTWLKSPQKYLAVIKGGTHFSTTRESSLSTGVLLVPPVLVGPAPSQARRYLKELSVAFFQTYVMEQPGYARYLTPAYTSEISQPPLRLSITQTVGLANSESAKNKN